MIQGCLWCLLNPWRCWLLTKSKRATEPFPWRAASLSDHQVLRVISDHQVLHSENRWGRPSDNVCVTKPSPDITSITLEKGFVFIKAITCQFYRSLGLHITWHLYHALGLFTACLFHVISQLQPLKARSNIRDLKRLKFWPKWGGRKVTFVSLVA